MPMFELKKLIREYVHLVTEALRSDEGIQEWLWEAELGDDLEGTGEDRSTGWTCNIKITCTSGPTDENLRAMFDEELKTSPLTPDQDYEEEFEQWKMDTSEENRPLFSVEYDEVSSAISPDHLISYNDLRAKNKEAAYEFGQYWSPNETLEIYSVEDDHDGEVYYVVKPFSVWKWGDFGWEKVDQDADEIKVVSHKNEIDLSSSEVMDILDDYTDKAFY